jgi:endonuclease G, mitochondrial
VPVSTFKVVVVLDSAGQGADDVTSATRVISVLVPNDDARVTQSADWETFRTSVRDIEQQTGLNLLSDVAPAVQDAVETRVDAL